MAGRALPEVTVVIPTKDRFEFLSMALTCALAQEEVEAEVIVVDDGSTDETAVKLARLQHPATRVLRSEVSCGVASACNRGAAEARGEWIAFLDDDDLWSPRKLRTQLDAGTGEGAGWVFCGAINLDEHRSVLSQSPLPFPGEVARMLLTHNPIPGGGSNVAVRRDVLGRLGGFDEQLQLLQDWDLYIRLALHAPAAVRPDVLVAYVEHPGGGHVRRPERVMAEFDYLERKHRDAGSRHGVVFDRAMLWRLVAVGQRRAGKRLAAARSYFRGAVAGQNIGNVVRASGMLLGERPMRAGRRLMRQSDMTAPDWLETCPADEQQANELLSLPAAVRGR